MPAVRSSDQRSVQRTKQPSKRHCGHGTRSTIQLFYIFCATKSTPRKRPTETVPSDQPRRPSVTTTSTEPLFYSLEQFLTISFTHSRPYRRSQGRHQARSCHRVLTSRPRGPSTVRRQVTCLFPSVFLPHSLPFLGLVGVWWVGRGGH
ncbi:hypothetical protein BC828DRAFT_381945 [Blastocladiella britannica]|nr:hypothetical protein BC828DRAFT_381945 [Blastocladiella britannica]